MCQGTQACLSIHNLRLYRRWTWLKEDLSIRLWLRSGLSSREKEKDAPPPIPSSSAVASCCVVSGRKKAAELYCKGSCEHLGLRTQVLTLK